MNNSKYQSSDRGGDVPGRGSRGNGNSSDERENSTARTHQSSAITCTACGLLIDKGRKPKSTADYTTTCSMDGAIRTRLTPRVDHICLSLPQNAVPTTPEVHDVRASPPQSVPMQRGRAYYEPPCRQPPSFRGITVTAGPTAAPEYDAGGPLSSSDDAQSYSPGLVPSNRLFHPMPRHLNGTANGFLDHYANRGEAIEGTPSDNPGLCSLPHSTSFLSNSTGSTAPYYSEYQDDPHRFRLPPILSYQRSSSRGSPQQGVADTTTTLSEHQGASRRALPPRNPFNPSNSGSPSVFPMALRHQNA